MTDPLSPPLVPTESASDTPGTRGRGMRGCAESVVNFLKREDGPTAVEYAVMLVLSIVVCITAITAIGEQSGLGMRIREVDRMPAWSDGGGI